MSAGVNFEHAVGHFGFGPTLEDGSPNKIRLSIIRDGAVLPGRLGFLARLGQEWRGVIEQNIDNLRIALTQVPQEDADKAAQALDALPTVFGEPYPPREGASADEQLLAAMGVGGDRVIDSPEGQRRIAGIGMYAGVAALEAVSHVPGLTFPPEPDTWKIAFMAAAKA